MIPNIVLRQIDIIYPLPVTASHNKIYVKMHEYTRCSRTAFQILKANTKKHGK